VPISTRHFDADQASEVQRAAEETAAHGASLAERAGFRSQSVAVEAAPTWKGIVDTAEERQASLIVLGSERRSGLAGHLFGSVAAAVVAHSTLSVLVVRPRS
jgi:nucleotide-binding universal stress UspA family protein